MKVVAGPDTTTSLREEGNVYVWPRAIRCCKGKRYLLEASLERPEGEFDLVQAEEGFNVWATRGLIQPDELHLELDRKGRVRAYWNNQGWIG